jgi:rhodanese-related sulfurtransferase
MTVSRSRSFLAAALVAALVSACSMKKPPEWPAVLAEVRERYPAVAQVSVAELAAELATTKPVLLDARAEEEFETSHLPGAHLAPDLDSALDVLARAPHAPVVVYCSVGLRSSALAEELVAHGYTKTRNLEGGIFAWANAGQALDDQAGAATKVHPFDARWGTLLQAERRAE